MAENTFTSVYTQDELNQAAQKLADLKALFLGLVTMTPDERASYAKMGERTAPFVQKAFEYAGRNAAFVPSYVNVTLLGTDLQSSHILLQLLNQVNELQSTISDTMMLAGSEAYTASLAIYNAIQQAAVHGVAGAQEAADDMSARFPGHKAVVPVPTPPTVK